jgi:hypothetical protein
VAGKSLLKSNDMQDLSVWIRYPVGLVGLFITVKLSLLTGRGGLQGCVMFRIPHFLNNWLINGGCQPYALATLYPQKYLIFTPHNSFLLEAE